MKRDPTHFSAARPHRRLPALTRRFAEEKVVKIRHAGDFTARLHSTAEYAQGHRDT